MINNQNFYQQKIVMSSRWYVIYSKMCFICNIFFFVFAVGNLFGIAVKDSFTYLAGFVITVAYFSFILNFIAAAVLIVFLLKGLRNVAPLWIVVTNIFTLFFQFFFFLFI